MEHAQRDTKIPCCTTWIPRVLILILMEHAQRDRAVAWQTMDVMEVLILILMEHAQRGFTQTLTASFKES